MKNKIPYGKQEITPEDIKGVLEVLTSDFLTQGPKVSEFENKFAEYIGSKYAVAVSNGTAALHLSALALNVKTGDKVITTPITFAASANCVLYAGGEVDFVDIDPDTYLIDLDKLEEKLATSPEGTYQGIIPVDFAGLPVDTERLNNIAKKHKLWVIEDACHAPGAYFYNTKEEKNSCGNGKYADLSIFSFHPVKHITAGEGGMITTNNLELYNKLQLFRTHGITKAPELLNENHGGWYYEMIELGYNYRISDINCALGISQLSKANSGLARRREIAAKYDAAFAGTKILTPVVAPKAYHAYHLYVIRVEDRKGLGWNRGKFPNAEKYYDSCLSLPM